MLIENTEVEARHPWPDGTYVQGGGRGLVFSRSGNHYRTAFVEAFPGDTFIRGEGSTIEEAEDAAWMKYQQYCGCSGHEWEARGYTNGGGICKHCGKFGSKVFSPEDLGLSCTVCGIPTYWCQRGEDFYCEVHEHVAKDDPRSTGSIIGDIFRALED